MAPAGILPLVATRYGLSAPFLHPGVYYRKTQADLDPDLPRSIQIHAPPLLSPPQAPSPLLASRQTAQTSSLPTRPALNRRKSTVASPLQHGRISCMRAVKLSSCAGGMRGSMHLTWGIGGRAGTIYCQRNVRQRAELSPC